MGFDPHGNKFHVFRCLTGGNNMISNILLELTSGLHVDSFKQNILSISNVISTLNNLETFFVTSHVQNLYFTYYLPLP